MLVIIFFKNNFHMVKRKFTRRRGFRDVRFLFWKNFLKFFLLQPRSLNLLSQRLMKTDVEKNSEVLIFSKAFWCLEMKQKENSSILSAFFFALFMFSWVHSSWRDNNFRGGLFKLVTSHFAIDGSCLLFYFCCRNILVDKWWQVWASVLKCMSQGLNVS